MRDPCGRASPRAAGPTRGRQPLDDRQWRRKRVPGRGPSLWQELPPWREGRWRRRRCGAHFACHHRCRRRRGSGRCGRTGVGCRDRRGRPFNRVPVRLLSHRECDCGRRGIRRRDDVRCRPDAGRGCRRDVDGRCRQRRRHGVVGGLFSRRDIHRNRAWRRRRSGRLRGWVCRLCDGSRSRLGHGRCRRCHGCDFRSNRRNRIARDHPRDRCNLGVRSCGRPRCVLDSGPVRGGDRVGYAGVLCIRLDGLRDFTRSLIGRDLHW